MTGDGGWGRLRSVTPLRTRVGSGGLFGSRSTVTARLTWATADALGRKVKMLPPVVVTWSARSTGESQPAPGQGRGEASASSGGLGAVAIVQCKVCSQTFCVVALTQKRTYISFAALAPPETGGFAGSTLRITRSLVSARSTFAAEPLLMTPRS